MGHCSISPTTLTTARTGHRDGEKSQFFHQQCSWESSWFLHLDDISSYVGSLDSTFFPSGCAEIFGEVEAAYDARRALSRIIVTGEWLVHSNRFVSSISLLEWQWGPHFADVEGGGCATLRLG